MYYVKSEEIKFSANILGVHFDDGPDKPYYTIEYVNEEGNKIEKQTTGERIRKLDFFE